MGTANAILRAFNNRKYIFFVTLMLDQAKLKAVEEKKKEEQGKWIYNKQQNEISFVEKYGLAKLGYAVFRLQLRLKSSTCTLDIAFKPNQLNIIEYY